MSKAALISLIVRVSLGITAVEAVANIVFEYLGIEHHTPMWIASMIAGGLAVAMRAYWNEKK